MANEVPFPSTDHVIKYPDMWTDIAVNEIPKYLRELANKYNMHFKLVSDIGWQCLTKNAVFSSVWTAT